MSPLSWAPCAAWAWTISWWPRNRRLGRCSWLASPIPSRCCEGIPDQAYLFSPLSERLNLWQGELSTYA
jgi:hypothetical protein